MALFLSFLKLACTDSWHATIFWGNTTIQSITLERSWPSFKTATDCNFPFETSPEPPSLSCAPTVLPAYFYSTILLYTSDLHVCSSRWITAAEYLILESSFPLEHLCPTRLIDHGTFSCWVRILLKTATASSNQLALIPLKNLFAISAPNCAVPGISYLSVSGTQNGCHTCIKTFSGWCFQMYLYLISKAMYSYLSYCRRWLLIFTFRKQKLWLNVIIIFHFFFF